MDNKSNVRIPVLVKAMDSVIEILQNNLCPIDGLVILRKGMLDGEVILITLEETVSCTVTEDSLFFFLEMPPGYCLSFPKKI